MSVDARRWIGGFLAVFVLAITVLAMRADGFTGVDLELNDGSAWLVDTSDGTSGRVNGAVREVEAKIRVVERGDDYSVLQAPGVLLVHNRSTESLTPIDAATLSIGGSFSLPESVDVKVGAGTVLVHRVTDGAVWTLNVADGVISALDPEVPTEVLGEQGLSTVGHDGTVHLLNESGELTVTNREGSQTVTTVPGDFTSVSTSGPNTVLLDANAGQVEVVGDAQESWQIEAGLDYVLQQPSSSSRLVALGSDDGRVWSAPLNSEAELEVVSAGNGSALLEPVIVGNCVFTVSTDEMRFIRTCGDDTVTMPLEGMERGTRVRLFVANERVWVDALDGERAVYLPEEGDPEEIQSWGSALFLGDDTEGEADANLGDNLTRGESGAESAFLGEGEVEQNGEGFEGGENQPPVARADEVNARAARSRLIEVLANDSDPNGDLLIVTNVESVPPEQGVVAVSPDRRSVQFTPAGGFFGPVSFGYEVSDGNGGVDRAIVRVTVVDETSNSAPEPVDDSAVARAGQEVDIPVLINDDDPEGDILELIDVTGERATVNVDARLGIVSITPDVGVSGELTFEYAVRDEFLLEGTATITLTVIPSNGRNQRPIAQPDLYVVPIGAQLTLSVLENDTDLEDDALTITDFTSISGDIDLDLDAETGEVEFPTSEPGTYVYTYVVEDDTGPAERLGIVRVEILDQVGNLPPVAVADRPPEFPPIEAGTSRSFDVLANDEDPNGDALVVVSVVPLDEQFAALGVIESPDGNFLFQPTSELVGSEVTFQYTISDGLETASATVTAQVIASSSRDEPPVAEDDRATVRAGQSVVVDVLANDIDPENLPLRIAEGSFDTNPAPGVTVIQEGDRLRVVTAADATGSIEFAYAAIDNSEQTDSAFVRVDILPDGNPNQPPVARNVDASTFEGEEVIIPVLDSATDPDGDPLSLADVTGAQNGIVEIISQAGGQSVLRYTPDFGFVGTDSFSFIVSDPDNAQDTAQARVVVQTPPEINSPPNAVDDLGFSVRVGRTLSIPVLANDRDIDGDVLSIARIGEPSLGTATIGGDQIVFTAPATIEDGPQIVSLQYWVADGNPIVSGRDDAYTAVVSIEVIPPEPEPPQPVPDDFGPFKEGEAHVLDVLRNDIDPDGNQQDLTIVAVEGSDAVSISADGRSIDLVAPDGPFSFTYTVSDADQEVAVAAVNVSVIPNLPPETGVDFIEIRQQETGELAVLENDSDADGDPISLLAISDPRGGFAEIIDIDAGIVRFTPDDTVTQGGFSYRISDGPGGHEVTGTAQVTVLPPANTAPTAAPGDFPVPAGETQTFNILNLVDDLETPNNLTISASGGNGDIQVTDLGNGSISIEAAIDGFGSSTTVDYTVADGGPGDPLTAESTIEINVVETRRPRAETVADGPFETRPGEQITLDNLVGNDLPTGENLQIIGARPSGNGGTVSVTNDGRGVSFTPDNGFIGTFNFTYTIEDETGQADRQATSGVVEVRVVGPPDTPSGLLATPSNGEVTLKWDPPSNNGGPITAYEVQLDEGQIVDAGTGTTYIWDDLANGSEYDFRVRAVNQAGPSDAWSTVASAQPEALPDQPSPPTGIPRDGQIEVSWTQPNSGGSRILDYELDIDGLETETVTETSFVFNGSNGVAAKFRVRARTSAGWGPWSGESAAVIPFGLPSSPTGLTCSVITGGLQLDWTAADNNGAAISKYTVKRQGAADVPVSTGTSAILDGLGDGFNGTFVVHAENSAGEGPGSNFTCTTADRPDAPSQLNVSTDPGEVQLFWAKPNDNGAEIVEYRATLSNGDQQTTSGLFASFVGLENGTSYTVTVEARNAVGWSDPSSQSASVTPAARPGPPTGVDAENFGNRESTVTWTAPIDDGGSPITYYDVRRNDGGFESTQTPVLSYTQTGLGNGAQSSFTVRACNAEGCGSWSEASDIVTSIGVPGPIRNLNCNPTANGIEATCTWTSLVGAEGITDYESQVRITEYTTFATQTDTTRVLNLVSGTEYFFRVRACNPVGCGGWNEISFRTPSGPTPVRDLMCNVAVSGTEATCTWLAPILSFATEYEIASGEGPVPITPFVPELTLPASTLSFDFVGLDPATTYFFRIRPCNAVGCRTSWNQREFTTP